MESQPAARKCEVHTPLGRPDPLVQNAKGVSAGAVLVAIDNVTDADNARIPLGADLSRAEHHPLAAREAFEPHGAAGVQAGRSPVFVSGGGGRRRAPTWPTGLRFRLSTPWR